MTVGDLAEVGIVGPSHLCHAGGLGFPMLYQKLSGVHRVTIPSCCATDNSSALLLYLAFCYYSQGMINKDIRRTNLLSLIGEFGSIRKLADVTDTPASYLSNIKNRVKAGNKPRSMGDDVARKFEEKLGKPLGWMDQLHLEINPATAIRRMRVLQLIEERLGGEPAQLAIRLGRPLFDVYRWISDEPGLWGDLDDSTARAIELASGLPQGWLDEQESVTPVDASSHDSFRAELQHVTKSIVEMAGWLTPRQLLEVRRLYIETLGKVARHVQENSASLAPAPLPDGDGTPPDLGES